jgi:iron complex transport system ATP-binding protein
MTLATDNLAVSYGDRVAVAPATIGFEAGELVGLIGPNGAGKTSLLRGLAGLVGDRECVHWQGRPMSAFAESERARAIAYLPQAPAAYWPLAVRELVALGRLPHRRFGERWRSADEEAVERAIDMTGIAELAHRSIAELSGGERMRVHLARAFAVEAPVLLVDEPVASLDPYHQLKVMQLLDDYRRSGRLVVAVLHDLNLALGHCSRLMLMDAGAIVADGAPGSVVDAATLARHYRIRAYLTEHEQRRIAVPWATLANDD